MVTRISHIDDPVVVAAVRGHNRKMETKWGWQVGDGWLREEKEEENKRGRDTEQGSCPEYHEGAAGGTGEGQR